jgi:hypothetical protein
MSAYLNVVHVYKVFIPEHDDPSPGSSQRFVSKIAQLVATEAGGKDIVDIAEFGLLDSGNVARHRSDCFMHYVASSRRV